MSVRVTCVEIVSEILENGTFFNTLKNRFEPKESAFGNRLVLSVLRYLRAIEEILRPCIRKPFSGKNRILRYILLCATAELLLTETPDYAVLNEYVTLARHKRDRFAAGMVNAVLRKIAADKAKICLKPAFPSAFCKILLADYTKEQIRALEEMLTIQPPLDLSVKENPEFWAKKLNGTLLANGTIRRSESGVRVTALEGFEEGLWWVQDFAASLPVALLGDVRGQKVLDLCAAPGGKTAQLLAKGAFVTAVDVDPDRLNRLKENMHRLSLEAHLTAIAEDGLRFLERDLQTYDAVLLDVPCSATGTYRRHPEVIHLKTTADIRAQLGIQAALLRAAAERVKKGGRLVYCTCSLAKAEGESQIERFLAEHPEFEVVEQTDDVFYICEGKKPKKNLLDKGVLRTFSYDEKDNGGMDAFFAICLKKTN